MGLHIGLHQHKQEQDHHYNDHNLMELTLHQACMIRPQYTIQIQNYVNFFIRAQKNGLDIKPIGTTPASEQVTFKCCLCFSRKNLLHCVSLSTQLRKISGNFNVNCLTFQKHMLYVLYYCISFVVIKLIFHSCLKQCL